MAGGAVVGGELGHDSDTAANAPKSNVDKDTPAGTCNDKTFPDNNFTVTVHTPAEADGNHATHNKARSEPNPTNPAETLARIGAR